MKITAPDFLKAVEKVVDQRMTIANRDQFIKDNHIMLPFKVKEAETDYLYEDGPDPVDGKLQAITSKQRREAFDKFVIDWRKQNSLEGTDVMPPNEVVPLWMRRAEGINQEMKIAHGEGRGPQQKFHDEYNRPLDKPPWRHINPRGESLDIDWQKEEYMKDHPQFFPEQQANMKNSIQRENVGGTLRDLMLPLLIKEYGKDGSGGYKNPSKLLSGMKKLAQGGRGHTTVGDKLYLDPIKQKLMPLPIDLESDKDKEIRHNQRFKV